MYPSASSRAATTAMFQAMANGGRALHFYAMEAFGVRNAALRLATALRTRAAIGTAAALELDVDCLAAPVAHHTAAPQILPPVPASPGPFPASGVVEPGIVCHVTHLPTKPPSHLTGPRCPGLESLFAWSRTSLCCKPDAPGRSGTSLGPSPSAAHSGPPPVHQGLRLSSWWD